jgi:hypothetical protein
MPPDISDKDADPDPCESEHIHLSAGSRIAH